MFSTSAVVSASVFTTEIVPATPTPAYALAPTATPVVLDVISCLLNALTVSLSALTVFLSVLPAILAVTFLLITLLSLAIPTPTPPFADAAIEAEPTWLSILVLSFARTLTSAFSPTAPAALTFVPVMLASVSPLIVLTVTVPVPATANSAVAATPPVITTLSISCALSAFTTKPVKVSSLLSFLSFAYSVTVIPASSPTAVIAEPLTVAFVSPLITFTAVDRPPAA